MIYNSFIMLRSWAVIISFIAAFTAQAADKTPFEPFWTKFKAWVASKNATQIASGSKFPIAMPHGATPIADLKDLRTRFADVFNGEADAAACFAKEVPEQREGRYEVACSPREGDEEAGKPIVYSFELVKGAWKFVGLDNINE